MDESSSAANLIEITLEPKSAATSTRILPRTHLKFKSQLHWIASSSNVVEDSHEPKESENVESVSRARLGRANDV